MMRNIFPTLLIIAVFITVLRNFNACSEQAPLQPVSGETVDLSLAKPAAGAYPQYAERNIKCNPSSDIYQGGNVQVNGGSSFHLEVGALTPPPGAVFGDDVKITMLVERDKFRTQLLFTFGPSGCTFDPPAEVTFDWRDLHSKKVVLYYIDEAGNYVPQSPEVVDLQNNKMTIHVSHFSRYAIGIE
jgi:hypothetical protein